MNNALGLETQIRTKENDRILNYKTSGITCQNRLYWWVLFKKCVKFVYILLALGHLLLSRSSNRRKIPHKTDWIHLPKSFNCCSNAQLPFKIVFVCCHKQFWVKCLDVFDNIISEKSEKITFFLFLLNIA